MYARAYVRIWTLRSWYNNSTSQWRVKIETRPFYRKKIQILKNMAVKPRLPWYISRRLYEGPNKYYWGKVAEFGGHSLNGFEVIQLFGEGSSKALPLPPRGRLNRINNKVNLYHHGNQLLIFPGTENRLGYVSRNNERKRREIIYVRQLLYCNLITVKSSYFVLCSRMADLLGLKKILLKIRATPSPAFFGFNFSFPTVIQAPFTCESERLACFKKILLENTTDYHCNQLNKFVFINTSTFLLQQWASLKRANEAAC